MPSNTNKQPKTVPLQPVADGLVSFQGAPALVPINSEQDMIVPFTFVMMKHNYSKLQIRAVIRLLKKLQNDLRRLFTIGHRAIINSSDKSLSIVFKDSDNVDVNHGKYEIIFKMADFNITSNNYDDIEKALAHMSEIPVQIPIKREGKELGEKAAVINFIKHTNLCDVSISERKYRKIVIFSFDPYVAEKFISTDFGYLTLYDSVIMKSNNRYTQLLYMYLSKFKDQHIVKISSVKLRERLNLTDKYKSFRHVKMRVLDAAKNNLDTLFDSGESDLKFSYECEYANPKLQQGEPKYVKFYITKRCFLTDEQRAVTENKLKNWIEKWFASLKIDDLQLIEKFSKIITPENWREIDKKFREICEQVNNPTVVNKPAYVLKCINNLYDEFSSVLTID